MIRFRYNLYSGRFGSTSVGVSIARVSGNVQIFQITPSACLVTDYSATARFRSFAERPRNKQVANHNQVMALRRLDQDQIKQVQKQ